MGGVVEDGIVFSAFCYHFLLFFFYYCVLFLFSLDGRCCRGRTCGEGQHLTPPFEEKMMLTIRRRRKGVMLTLVMMLMNARLMTFTGY